MYKRQLRKLPVAIKEKVHAELDRLLREGIIAPVTELTPWISALLVVTKPNGSVRICIDPKPLNKALMRDHYPMQTIDDVLPKLSQAKVFSTVDAANAFWHLRLDEESSKLTTYETPFGKFRWLRLVFHQLLNCSSVAYMKSCLDCQASRVLPMICSSTAVAILWNRRRKTTIDVY